MQGVATENLIRPRASSRGRFLGTRMMPTGQVRSGPKARDLPNVIIAKGLGARQKQRVVMNSVPFGEPNSTPRNHAAFRLTQNPVSNRWRGFAVSAPCARTYAIFAHHAVLSVSRRDAWGANRTLWFSSASMARSPVLSYSLFGTGRLVNDPVRFGPQGEPFRKWH